MPWILRINENFPISFILAMYFWSLGTLLTGIADMNYLAMLTGVEITRAKIKHKMFLVL
jgi:hypothetical protein